LRVKSQWFREGREKTPQEIAGAAAFIVWRISQNVLNNMRKADFDVAVGDQYFDFLSESLIYLIQVADRIAYKRLGPEARIAFTTELAKRVGATLAENQCDLLGGDVSERCGKFFELLNLRSGEYAEFDYRDDGPDFAFTRYFAYCLNDVVDEKDKRWVVSQVMEVEAPEAAVLLEKAMRGLLEIEPRRRPARSALGGE
jgi:hypothetical protein